MFHVVSTWNETELRQPDLQEVGSVFSLVSLPVLNLVFLGSMAAFAASDTPGVRELLVKRRRLVMVAGAARRRGLCIVCARIFLVLIFPNTYS